MRNTTPASSTVLVADGAMPIATDQWFFGHVNRRLGLDPCVSPRTGNGELDLSSAVAPPRLASDKTGTVLAAPPAGPGFGTASTPDAFRRLAINAFPALPDNGGTLLLAVHAPGNFFATGSVRGEAGTAGDLAFWANGFEAMPFDSLAGGFGVDPWDSLATPLTKGQQGDLFSQPETLCTGCHPSVFSHAWAPSTRTNAATLAQCRPHKGARSSNGKNRAVCVSAKK